MILIDLTQVLIASLMAQTRGGKEPINEDLVRHICLKSLAMYRKKYFKTYGELVLADDSYNVWRKDVYPFYKANRKKTRDNDDKDWNQIFDCITVMREELKYNFPYKYICISKCEADDVVAVTSKYLSKKGYNVYIIASDTDYLQLTGDSNIIIIMNLIVDAAKDKVFLKIITNKQSYTNEYSNTKENFDKMGIIIFEFLEKNNFKLEEIKNLYVNIGPGKFSSIRSSIVSCKAISMSNNINLYGFSSNQIEDNDYKKLLELSEKGVLMKNLINPIYSG